MGSGRAWVDLGYGPRRFPGARLALARLIARTLVAPFFRFRVEGLELLPAGSSVVVFNHLSWFDPIVLLAALPGPRPVYFFGPREPDMSRGGRNRLMRWAGITVPYQPDRRDIVRAAHRVETLLANDAILAIAGEGRIHVGENRVRALSEGPAFFALRSHVPAVPVAINGTGWLGFGRPIRVRVGPAIATDGLDRRRDAALVTQRIHDGLAALVADWPDRPPPGPLWRRLTETFNDWPEGHRPDLPTEQP